MFVPKQGDLGRKKAGWLHKAFWDPHVSICFVTNVFPFVFSHMIFFWWAVLKGSG